MIMGGYGFCLKKDFLTFVLVYSVQTREMRHRDEEKGQGEAGCQRDRATEERNLSRSFTVRHTKQRETRKRKREEKLGRKAERMEKRRRKGDFLRISQVYPAVVEDGAEKKENINTAWAMERDIYLLLYGNQQVAIGG